jgi:hypothetical protein
MMAYRALLAEQKGETVWQDKSNRYESVRHSLPRSGWN